MRKSRKFINNHSNFLCKNKAPNIILIILQHSGLVKGWIAKYEFSKKNFISEKAEIIWINIFYVIFSSKYLVKSNSQIICSKRSVKGLHDTNYPPVYPILIHAYMPLLGTANDLEEENVYFYFFLSLKLNLLSTPDYHSPTR